MKAARCTCSSWVQATSDIRPLAAAGSIGIAHHGEVTDRLYKQGEIDARTTISSAFATRGFWWASPRT